MELIEQFTYFRFIIDMYIPGSVKSREETAVLLSPAPTIFAINSEWTTYQAHLPDPFCLVNFEPAAFLVSCLPICRRLSTNLQPQSQWMGFSQRNFTDSLRTGC
jgi:hypothetical protein